MQTFALKFVMLGDSFVGKSQLSRKFCRNEFNESSQPTEGMQFSSKEITFEKCIIKAQIWDIGGSHERPHKMTKAYFKDSVGALIVYDTSNEESYNNVKSFWLDQLVQFGFDKMSIVLVGNKKDLKYSDNCVQTSEAISFARSKDIDFTEVSAYTGENVDIAFRRLILSVAKLLPDVKTHLDLTGLPDGWIVSYRNDNKTSTSSNYNCQPFDSEKMRSFQKIDISGSISRSKSLNSTDNSELSYISKSSATEDVTFTRKNTMTSVYLNYWTGEESYDIPKLPAKCNFLHEATVITELRSTSTLSLHFPSYNSIPASIPIEPLSESSNSDKPKSVTVSKSTAIVKTDASQNKRPSTDTNGEYSGKHIANSKLNRCRCIIS